MIIRKGGKEWEIIVKEKRGFLSDVLGQKGIF
jgi:hypothetical protein